MSSGLAWQNNTLLFNYCVMRTCSDLPRGCWCKVCYFMRFVFTHKQGNNTNIMCSKHCENFTLLKLICLVFLVIWVVLCRLIKSFVQVCTLTLTLGHSTSTTAYNKNNLMTPCHKITTWMANQIILLYYCKFIFPEAFAPVLFIYFYVKQCLEFPFIVFLLLF